VVERADKRMPAGSAGPRRMSRERKAKIRARQRRRRLGLLLAVAAVLLLVAAALFLSRDESSRTVEQPVLPASTSDTTLGPYDFSQVADDFSLTRVREAKFVSVTVGRGEATKSFMLTRERPEFAALAAAVAEAEVLETGQAPPAGEEGAQLVFVTTERGTVDLSVGEEGHFYWRGKAFRPAQDLTRLIDDAERLEGEAG
jgi:hypothetical protein